MAADRVLLSRDDRTISLVEIASATATPGAAATVGFRIVVVQCYGAGVPGDADEEGDDVDTMEDVACRVPVGELVKGGDGAAAAVDLAFEALVSRLDHPTLIPEVAPEARKAAARVRAMCADREVGAALAGVEFRLRLVFLDPLEDESEPESEDQEEEEVGSDLEFDEECWERGRLDDGDTGYEDVHVAPALVLSQPDGGAWRYEHGEASLIDGDDEEGGGQFSARPFDGALAREGGPSDASLLLSGFEARADGPEPDEQHELTLRDVRHLVRLAFSGGDVEDDEAYQRALATGEPVSPATRAVMFEQAMRSAGTRPPPAPPSGMPPRMRTG